MKSPASPSPRPVAIVTGALRGIGRATAGRLAASGFDVLLVDLPSPENLARSAEVVAELAAAGADSQAVFSDVGELGSHAALVAAALDRWGRLDSLVNNAGVAALQRGDLLAVTPESYDRCFRVNARAVFFLTQTVAKAMLAAPPALPVGAAHRSIITITSSNAAAVSIARGEYCASKAAASMVAQLFALRLAGAGIGVYEIRPGIIDTEMTRPAKARYDALIAEHGVPAERWGTPEDIATTAVTLAEGRLPFTVGQVIAPDGGLTMVRF